MSPTHVPRSGRIARFAVSLALLLCIGLPSTARAQPLADRVPADAILYVGWLGCDAKSPGFEGSHLKAVLDAGEFRKLVDEVLPKILQKISEKDRGAAEAIAIAKPIVMPLLKHPTAIFVGKPELVANQEPKIKAGLICQAGADSDAMLKHLQDLMQNAPDQVKAMVKVSKQGDAVVVSVNYADGEIGAAGKGLTGAPGFMAMKPHTVASPSVMLYVDVEQLLATVAKGIDVYGDLQVQQLFPKVRDAIGLQGVKRFVWSAGFDGKDWADHLFLHAPEPRAGLFALADPTPLSEAAMKSIPVTATMAGATKLDLSKLVGGIRGAIAQVDPDTGRKVDELFTKASRDLGMDIQKDILDNLGDEWVYYSDPMTGGRGMFGLVMVNRLRNAEKAQATLTKLEGMLNDVLAKNIPDKDISIKMQTTKYGDTTIHYLGTPLVSPAWAIKGQYLFVALFPQMVAGAVDQVAGGKSILDNPKYQAIRQRLGVTNANGFWFADLQQTAPDGYALWVAISRLSGFSDMFGVQSPAMLLPPLNKLMPHLAPAGMVTWTDKDGIHAKGITPFPGAEVIASDPLGGLLMMAPAMVMPMYAARARAVEAQRGAAAENEAVRRAIEEERARGSARPGEPRPAQPPVAPPPPRRPTPQPQP